MKLFKYFLKFKNKIAIFDKTYSNLTFQQVINQTNDLKKVIKSRSLILIISENTIGSLIAYIFCLINNHVAIIIDYKTENHNLIKIFQKYQPNYIFLSKKRFSFLKKKCLKKKYLFDQILIKNKVSRKVNLNKDLSLLLSTSGTMGSIKFVKLSKKNLKHNTDSIIKYLKINKNDSAIINLPISYSYMLSIINTHLEVGASIVISKNSIIEKDFWNIYKSHKITSFNGVPFTYEILNKIGINNIKSKSLRYLTHAGGKIDNKSLTKLLNFCSKNKLKFFSMYGQTEASPRISYLDPKFSKNKLGSIGKGLKENKIYIVNENNKKISKPFTEGEIVCVGKNIFMGYSKGLGDLIKPSETNYSLKTGDLGYFDKEGFFYISSRLGKIAKIFGYRVDIEALENAMNKKGFKVVCLDNKNKISVFTEKKYNKNLLIQTISKISNLNIRSFSMIKLKYFPRTSNNKISYNELKKINDRL